MLYMCVSTVCILMHIPQEFQRIVLRSALGEAFREDHIYLHSIGDGIGSHSTLVLPGNLRIRLVWENAGEGSDSKTVVPFGVPCV